MKEIAKNIFWIETSRELAEFCRKVSQSPALALDTEFMRTHTFWPEACLIQIGSTECCALIDPKSKNIDWSPFLELLQDHKITKILHAGRQDMEIFYHLWKVFPFPLFDTQVAATMCGYDDNISYENLVQQILSITLDKTQQFSNWSRRPLSHRQLLYAAADVVHLPHLYEALKDKMGSRHYWVQEDLEPLYDPHLYAPLPAKAWKRFKPGRPQSLKYRKVLHKLSSWREELAQTQNIARKRILKDGILLELCHRRPTTLEELKAIPLVVEISEIYYEIILQLIQTALTEDLLERPERRRRIKEEDMTALKALTAEIAALHDIPLRVLATKKDLEALLSRDLKSRCLQGWRHEIFGIPALKLLENLETARIEAAKAAQLLTTEEAENEAVA